MRQRGDLEATRATRYRFQKTLIPSSNDWNQWLDDELGLATTEAEKLQIKLLFELALKDYPASVDLWSKYLDFCQDNSELFPNLDVEFKRAAAFPAWNLKRGHLLLQNMNESVHRAIPYTKQARKEFNSEDSSIGPFDSFEAVFPQNLDKYIEAVKASKFVSSADKLTLCRVLFERAIEECEDGAASFSLLEEYLKFLRSEMNVSTIILALNSRLIRAHPLNVNSWILFMESLELFNKFSEIETLWNESIPKFLLQSSHEVFLILNMAHLDCLRRSGNNDLIIFTFKNTIKDEGNLFASDSQARLSRYFAQVLFSFGIVEEFRNVWQNLLKEHAKEAAFWLEYLQMERTLAFTDKSFEIVRNGYKRAAVAVTDYPETIFYDWLQFERQQGTSLQNLIDARERIDKQRSILREREQQRQQKDTSSRKRSRAEHEVQVASADQAVKPVKTFNPEATLFVNNLPFTFTEKDIETHFNSFATQLSTDNPSAQVKSIRMHMNHSGNSFKGHATVEFDCPQTASLILERFNRKPADGSNRPVFLAKYSSPLELKKPPQAESDAKTLYISNLAFTDTLKVEEMFKTVQGIQQIRHVAGKHFAYIEFETEIRAKEALKEIEELDKTIKVAFSNPPKAKNNNVQISSTFLKPRALTVKK